MKEYKLTTLCYLTKGEDILFIVKGATQKNLSNMNVGKYLGVGGHIEDGESSYECIVREIREETGISAQSVKDLKLKGVAFFINDMCDNEIMYIYKGEYVSDVDPCPGTCDEGVLTWVNKSRIYDLPIWEGDREIFRLLFGRETGGTFEIKLTYHGDDLISVETY
ncbi:MAG: NUDIX domain-containing protein [Clostridiales bacterium]|nr:NUDIX domain-containing protein [Clostridiales bacterium]